MGMNATVVVLLDSLHRIKEDPEFGAKLVRAIQDQITSQKDEDLASGGANVAVVVEQHHADHMSVVAVGANGGQVLSTHAGDYTSTPEGIVRALADNLGYRLVRKPKR